MSDEMYMALLSELWEIEKILTDMYGSGARKCEQGIGHIVRIKEILRNERED